MHQKYRVGAALFSRDGRYRYLFRRELKKVGAHMLLFCMLNPSKAGADDDDPTTLRCGGFAESWGFAEFVVVNMYALVSTDPRGLRKARWPVAPRGANFIVDRHIREQAARASMVVCAWGAMQSWQYERSDAVIRLLRRENDIHTLGFTKDGHPNHPLYLPSDLQPVLWKARTQKVACQYCGSTLGRCPETGACLGCG